MYVLRRQRGEVSGRDAMRRFAVCFSIPDSLDSCEVAPMLCGGQTVWTPLKEQTKPGDKIGVLGLEEVSGTWPIH